MTVDVYDVMGRHMARVVDADQAPGRYAVPIPGDTWASGIYVVTLRAGQYHYTARMTRVR